MGDRVATACRVVPNTSWPSASSWRASVVPANPLTPVMRNRIAARQIHSAATTRARVVGDLAANNVQIGIHHDLQELLEVHRWLPAEASACLGRVTDEVIDFRRPQQRRVLADIVPPIETD